MKNRKNIIKLAFLTHLAVLMSVFSTKAGIVTYTVSTWDDDVAYPTTTSLRWAINHVNSNAGGFAAGVLDVSSTDYYKIIFTASAPHTIKLAGYLDIIRHRVEIHGETGGVQTDMITPNITIDAADNMPWYGIFCFGFNNQFGTLFDPSHSLVQGLGFKNNIYGISINSIALWGQTNGTLHDITIKNCIITGFDHLNYYGKMGIYMWNCTNITVTGCHIGRDVAGSPADAKWYTQAGIYMDQCNQCVIGGSGSDANVIANCGEDGILIFGGHYNWLTQNSIYNDDVNYNFKYRCCEKAIALSWDDSKGNDYKPAPTITTVVTGGSGTISGKSEPSDIVEVFKSSGTQNADIYLGFTTANSTTGAWVYPSSGTMSIASTDMFTSTASKKFVIGPNTFYNTSQLSDVSFICNTPVVTPVLSCSSDVHTLTIPTGIYSIQWYRTVGGTTTPLGGETSNVLNPDAYGAGTYTVTVTNGSCVKTSAPITVYP